MKLFLGNYEVDMIHHDPIIFTVEGILTNEECDHFKRIASKGMKRSMVSSLDKQKNKRGLLFSHTSSWSQTT